MASRVSSPFSPVDPQAGIRSVDSDQNSPLASFVICPNTVDRFAVGCMTVYQTARVWSISRIILDDFAPKNREKNRVKGEVIFRSLLIRMVGNPSPSGLNRFNDVGYFHRFFSTEHPYGVTQRPPRSRSPLRSGRRVRRRAGQSARPSRRPAGQAPSARMASSPLPASDTGPASARPGRP